MLVRKLTGQNFSIKEPRTARLATSISGTINDLQDSHVQLTTPFNGNLVTRRAGIDRAIDITGPSLSGDITAGKPYLKVIPPRVNSTADMTRYQRRIES